MNIGQFNTKILKEDDMKLCIHSHVFYFIFFRNKEGLSLNEDYKEKSEKDEELNILRQIIVDRGILFFRMNPNDKTKLVQLF